jgi:hypothetical protein
MVAKDAFDQWWEWAERPLDIMLTIPAEIHEPVMQLAPEDRRDRDKVNKAVRRWSTSGSLRYDGAIRMPGSSTQASRANHA